MHYHMIGYVLQMCNTVLESCNLNFMYILRNSNKMICFEFFQFCKYRHLEEGDTIHFQKKLYPLYTRILCAKFSWIKSSCSWVENILRLSMYFHFVAIMSPLKNAWPFDFLHTGIFCAKFDWNWPSCSGKDFHKLSIYFHSFYIIFP